MYRMWYICVYIDLYMYFVLYQILKYSSWYERKRDITAKKSKFFNNTVWNICNRLSS